ncbi:hypothetical protein [Xanthomonas oryzae]|uniref:hypothetical protein n=1 Tax=Xanthomonas oryzae TaxID=347 RepID=UPI0010346200|nr:hypothetical protein [Xanthomonas oryzae]QBG94298.1 hypothetical protein EYC55_00480 [Xanthomonas oryzae]QBG98224.1 hypothetical protein EYC56_00490 [Xanthomonas oryzae]
MIKDRKIKEQALRYAVTRYWYPHMEVEVAPPARVGRRAALVTDIDVLAIISDPVIGSQTVLFDCKTKASESGANRSLWLSGLLKHFSAEQAFCVLKKSSIDFDHRQFAQDLGVILIPEDEFENFSKVSCGRDLVEGAAVASLDAWDRINNIKSRFPAFSKLMEYRAGEFWRSRSKHSGCRKLLANVLQSRAEFDPDHVEHQALFGDFCSLFALAMASLASSIFKIMLLPDSVSDFEEAVRMKLYGGREEYEQQNNLFKLLKQARHGAELDQDLAPPDWARFLKLLRQLLDDPMATQRAALILKECGFSLLAPSGSFLKDITKSDRQAVRFAILIADYFSRATKVPPEFSQRLEAQLMGFA